MSNTAGRNRSIQAFVLVLGVVACVVATAGSVRGRANGVGNVAPIPDPVLISNELLTQAAADECFVDIGIDYPPMNPDGTCPQGVPKTNESYIWGLTEESGRLWFGTMANTLCVLTGQDPAITALDAGVVVCEFGQSQYARTFPNLPDTLGDWRPPVIYSYELATATLVEHRMEDPLIRRTLGFRGAGSIDNIAFLGGPALLSNSVNLFAFKADTGELLGACEHIAYNYIRKWDNVDNVLYVGVGSPTAGAVLRWVGDMSSFEGNFCEDFVEVGHLTAHVANVTPYTGGDGQPRLAATTVPIRTPSGGSTGTGVGVWISPPLGVDGLNPEDADGWRQVWTPLTYDPDRITARFGYSGGAVQFFDGWLYWGTIHLQNSGALRVHQRCTEPYCFGVPQTPEEAAALTDGVYRNASVWRGRNLEDPLTREVQLLYGESELPACCVAPKTFEMRSTGWTPLYGPSGFGTRSNEYIWQMAVYGNRLFMGTYDAAVLQGAPDIGADLWRFDNSTSPAVNENSTGLGDPLNYGVRALWPLDDGSGVIVGMANPFNLAPGGGWELRRLSEGPPP